MVQNLRERSYIFDADLELQDSATIASSAAGQVGGSDKIVDLGADVDFHGAMVVDVSAIEIATNDELYEIILEGSDESDFASTIEALARLELGANEVLTGGTDTDSDTGRYVVPFMNDMNGRNYRYLRVNFVISGTIATGITLQVYASKHKLH